MKKEGQARFLFGISLTDRPTWRKFLICSSGFFFGCLVNGICEGITTKQMVNPWKTYVKLSAVLMGSHGLTKGSACDDANTSPNFSVIGVLMIMVALIMDSFLGNFQEEIFTVNPETSQMEMLFCSTVVGLPFLLPRMILTGELFKAWNSCSEHLYVYVVLVFEAMATFIGQVSVLSLIALFGAATTAMVTTARKAVTLMLSYLIFTKPLTEQHGSGLLLIAMGIILKLFPDSKPPSRAVVRDTTSTQGVFHQKEANKPLENRDSEEAEEKRPLV